MTRNFKRMRPYNRGDIWLNYCWNERCFRPRLYCTDNKNTHFVFNKFFFSQNRTVYEIMWQKYCRNRQATGRRMTEATNRTCNTRRVQKEIELFKWRANKHRQRAAATERT